MSLSKPAPAFARNPAKKYIKWNGGGKQGYFTYYDKDIADPKERNVKIELKNFIVLDKDLFTIRGFKDGKPPENYQSNAVRSVDDVLTVMRYVDKNKSVLMKGTYTELKDAVKSSRDLKYSRELYLFLNGELVHVHLTGAAFSAWVSIEGNANHSGSYISHTENAAKTKGQTDYIQPVFAIGGAPDEETMDAAIKADQELQAYLEIYFGKKGKGDINTGGEHEGHEHAEQTDTEGWRDVQSPAGIILGALSHADLLSLQEKLVQEGDTGEMYDYVTRGLYDYQQAVKSWKDQVDGNGKKLTDYTLDDLKTVYAKVKPSNKSRQLLEAAIEAKIDDEFEDDENIPF